MTRPVRCPGCDQLRNWRSFRDEEKRFSRLCEECRRASVTGPQTPQARRASGMISTTEVRRLLEEQRREDAEADTIPPPPEPDRDD